MTIEENSTDQTLPMNFPVNFMQKKKRKKEKKEKKDSVNLQGRHISCDVFWVLFSLVSVCPCDQVLESINP